MRSVRMRILATLLVLAAVGVGGWQLLPDQRDENKTVTVGTTDAVTSLDPAGPYDAAGEDVGGSPCRTAPASSGSGASPGSDGCGCGQLVFG